MLSFTCKKCKKHGLEVVHDKKDRLLFFTFRTKEVDEYTIVPGLSPLDVLGILIDLDL